MPLLAFVCSISLKYSVYSFFSEMGTPVVVSLAIQTSVVGVKWKEGHKEHSSLCVQGQFSFFDISQKLL